MSPRPLGLLISLGLISLAAANIFEPSNGAKNIVDDGATRHYVTKNHFGATQVVSENYDEVIKELIFQDDIYRSYETRYEYIKSLTAEAKILKEKQAVGDDRPMYQCQGRDQTKEPFDFLPVYAGMLNESISTFTYTDGLCFKETIFTIEYEPSPQDFTSVSVTVETRHPRSLFCTDSFFLGSLQAYHVEDFALPRKHHLKYTNLNADMIEDIKFNGIRVYLFCDGITKGVTSVFNTMLLFLGGMTDYPWLPVAGSHVPKYMSDANINFLNETMGWQIETRPIEEVHIDESEIKTGDFLMIYRLDGLDEIIMYGTGGHVGHSTMAMWFPDGELYVVESQSAWYWPTHGIQKTPIKKWLKQAKEASFNVALLPLKDEYRAKWNYTSGMEFFNATEGLPYGYHTFLWGWIDTPIDNLPPLVPSEFVPIVFEMLNKYMPAVVDMFWTQGLNKHLGTEGLSYPDIAAQAAEQGMTIQDLMAVPELDGWLYTGFKRDGLSYVCSSFLIAMYKNAGLFGDQIINPQEFTPRDVYNLDIFNPAPVRPQACIDADPDLPYCQLLGKHRINIAADELSVVSSYSNMDQECPSINPQYIRPQGC